MTANNVIKGPWVGNDPTVAVPLLHGVQMVKALHIQETLVTLMPMLFNNIELAGFVWDEQGDKETEKDATLIVEAVKSLLFKYHGMHHPLQTVAEGVFVADADSNIDFATHVSVELKPMEPLVLDIEDYDDEQDALEE
jgi:hypothetical protein